jgi:hypothetical protein
MFPELRPIMSGDSDALIRLKEEIERAESHQQQMKKVNAAHKSFLKKPANLEKCDLTEEEKKMVITYKPRYSWEPHPFAPFQLQNNSANIRRLKARYESISKAKETPDIEVEGANATVQECPADNRLRIRFPGIPDREVREKLKKSGFRWTPSLGVWQSYLNHRSRVAALELACIYAKGTN